MTRPAPVRSPAGLIGRVMTRGSVETLVGIATVVLLAVALYSALGAGARSGGGDGTRLFARFTYVGDLSPGSDVKIGGIKVGTVTEAVFDPGTRLVTVRLVVDPAYTVPHDSRATIVADGLVGGAHLKIDRGRSDRLLASNGVIDNTSDSLDIAALVGRIIFEGITARQAAGSGTARADQAGGL